MPIFKIAIFEHDTWQVAKVPEVAHIPSFNPSGFEIVLIFGLPAAVSEIRADFEIAIFGHETWQLVNVPEAAHILSFSPKWSKLSLFSL